MSSPGYTSSQSPSEEKSIRYGLPCETDHMYANYQQVTGNEANKYRELVSEVTQLKALLLFHLDLIQQQSECNASKDKQLLSLRHENEMLRQRLERMERRVFLQKQKPEVDPAVQESGEVGCSYVEPNLAQLSEANTSSTGSSSKEEVSTSPRKRIKTLLPVGKRSSSTAVVAGHARNGAKNAKILATTTKCSTVVKCETRDDEKMLDDLINQAVKEGAILNIMERDQVVDSHLLDAKVVLEPCPLPVLTDASQLIDDCADQPPSPANSERKTHSRTLITILPEHKRIQQLLTQKPAVREAPHLKKENLVTTDQLYFTHIGEAESRQVEIHVNESEVEVPRWSVKPISSRHPVEDEAIENLDDEVFTKRHLKHEIDEKRRKRWDLQRIREQRQYEKLRARYEGEDRSQDRCSPSTATATSSASRSIGETVVQSLWPQPEDASHLQVEPWLPVTAFGAPLVNVVQTEYVLPWVCTRPATATPQSAAVPNKKRQRR